MYVLNLSPHRKEKPQRISLITSSIIYLLQHLSTLSSSGCFFVVKGKRGASDETNSNSARCSLFNPRAV